MGIKLSFLELLFEVIYLLSRLTEILEVDPDLVHSACEGPAQHHAGAAIEAHPLKLRPKKPDIELYKRQDIELYLHSLPWLETLHTPIL